MNQMKTSEKIIEYIRQKNQASARELADFLELSDRAVFKQLDNLSAEKKLVKIGRPPRVFYLLSEGKVEEKTAELDSKTKKIIEENYLIITPAGERKQGTDGFAHWCRANELPFEKTAGEYVKTLKKYQAFRKNGLLDGMRKFKGTFEKVNLDEIFYVDFYSIERFGRQNSVSCSCMPSRVKTKNL
jgi:hypothetical protein